MNLDELKNLVEEVVIADEIVGGNESKGFGFIIVDKDDDGIN